MPTVRLLQVPVPPADRNVWERRDSALEDCGPFVLGPGDIDLICASCEYLLVGGLERGSQLRGFVFRCQACGTYNQTRT